MNFSNFLTDGWMKIVELWLSSRNYIDQFENVSR